MTLNPNTLPQFGVRGDSRDLSVVLPALFAAHHRVWHVIGEALHTCLCDECCTHSIQVAMWLLPCPPLYGRTLRSDRANTEGRGVSTEAVLGGGLCAEHWPCKAKCDVTVDSGRFLKRER